MLSERTLAAVCTDVAEIFEALDDSRDIKRILLSKAFERIRNEVLKEKSKLTDTEILTLLFKEYSVRLKKT